MDVQMNWCGCWEEGENSICNLSEGITVTAAFFYFVGLYHGINEKISLINCLCILIAFTDGPAPGIG